MQHYTDTLYDTLGNAISGASVQVYAAGTTTPSTIYSDNSSTTTTNPLTTGTDGSFDFYAANGRYDLVITHPNHTFTSADTAGLALFDLSGYTSTKAVVSGFTRLAPNFCIASVNTQASWTATTGSPPTGQFINSGLANGTHVVLRLHFKAKSGNGIAVRTLNTIFYTNIGGATQVCETKFTVYEHAAVAAGTVIGEGEDTVILPTSNSGYVYATDLNTGGNGTAYIEKATVVGYYD